MTTLVKYFIEDNIDLIDEQDFLQVFKNSMNPNNGLANEDFKEFLNVLKSIGIGFTDVQLKELFIQVMKNEIIQYFQFEPDESENMHWFLTHVPNNLCSYNISEVEEIFVNNAYDLGITILNYNDDNYTKTFKLMK